MTFIRIATLDDFDDFLCLAREVEPLFGPMVDSSDFCAAVKGAIGADAVICAVGDTEEAALQGACVIDSELNEIAWLAVSNSFRGEGVGTLLLTEAMRRLGAQRPIRVTTFADLTQESVAAKKLYKNKDSWMLGLAISIRLVWQPL